MIQPITDQITLLKDARKAVEELNQMSDQETELSLSEKQVEKALETEKKAVADSVNGTIKKRREEINTTYDKEISKGQEKLKKARAKREKAKNQGVKERIAEETAELKDENRQLKLSIKSLFQQNQVPSICRSDYYYALYFPRWGKEILTFLVTILICFLVIPYGAYMLIPDRKTWYLVVIYLITIFLFGGLYVLVGNKTKMAHLDVLKKARLVRDQIHSNDKKIKVITHSILKDRNEAMYDLQVYDDEIAQAEQELAETTGKKRDAVNSFETVTKNIISDEINNNSKERLEQIAAELMDKKQQLQEISKEVKSRRLQIADNYEVYIGKEFMVPDKLEALEKLMSEGTSTNISEAIEAYRMKDTK